MGGSIRNSGLALIYATLRSDVKPRIIKSTTDVTHFERQFEPTAEQCTLTTIFESIIWLIWLI